MASTYENYLEPPKSLTFDQLRDLHQKLLKPELFMVEQHQC